ncbi:MAG: hypothetical protein HQK87_05375 [Nitrospinae bacterium]|nr:hypothetical protein [Nitrospinota bacterium]
MSMGIPSAKFAGGADFHRSGIASRKAKVAPSIAEQAIFIPKPHKRVEFQLNTEAQVMGGGKGGEPLPTLGSGGKGGEAAPLPGSGQTGAVPLPGSDESVTAGGNGQNIAQGSLGTNGLTAQFNKVAYNGGNAPAAGGSVEMEILSDPAKQHEVIATQEEGRQVNHKEIHFTQQYDSYGRPRIGFSREPYDFAATKFMSITSQVRFQANMAKVHEEYDQYLYDPAKAKPDEAPKETPIFGATSDPTAEQDAANKEVKFLGGEGGGDPSSAKKSAAAAFEASQVKVKDVFTKGAASGAPADAEGLGEKGSDGSKGGEGSDQNISGGGTVNLKA